MPRHLAKVMTMLCFAPMLLNGLACVRQAELDAGSPKPATSPTTATPTTTPATPATPTTTPNSSSASRNPVSPPVATTLPDATQPTTNVTPPTNLPKDNIVGEHSTLLVPITPFSNMETGYQATNEGFRAFLTDEGGQVIAAGPMSMDAVVNGRSDDASSGSAYGKLIMNIKLAYLASNVAQQGNGSGKLSICMGQSADAPYTSADCRTLGSGGGGFFGNSDAGRPFQYINMPVNYQVSGQQIAITRYNGDTGEGGTPQQIALSVYHPAYAFAAPQKAFKDFQSPLVLSLNEANALDLINVWDDATAVRFDLSADGTARRTGWVGKSSGFLVLPAKGKVTSGAQLFGEYFGKTAQNAKGSKTYDNGYEALAQFDGNHDKAIDGKDKVFKRLMIWRDANSDGVAQGSELTTLAKLKIKAIHLDHHEALSEGKPMTVQDNEIRLIGSYETTDGKRHLMGDVWFKQRTFSDAMTSRP